MRRPPLAIFAGVRTPFLKAGGLAAALGADELGTIVARELLLRTGIDAARLDHVVTGNVGQPVHAANLSRVIALRAGVPASVPAYTVHRNCASGFEAVTQCADLLAVGRGRLFLALGTESMSNYPLLFGSRARDWFSTLSKAKSFGAKLRSALRFRPSMMKPEVALLLGLTDPVAGMGMGETAEVLAREWQISREEQDRYAAASHAKALAHREILREETMDLVVGSTHVRDDDGVRSDSTPERLAKLRAVFAKVQGSVTAGNASQITDGAVALLVGDPALSGEIGLEPLGLLEDFAYAGCDPARMGLGPVHAMSRLLPADSGPALEAIDHFEINEAFAVQVLSCVAAAESDEFARRALGRSTRLGRIPTDRLNPLGGAIALGHPVGASGARLVLSALLSLRRSHKRRALVSACIGGGQGAALVVTHS